MAPRMTGSKAGGRRLCLIGAIDDATDKVMGGLFTQAESSWGYFHLFCEIFKNHGLPQSIYTDCHSVFFYRPGTDARGAVDQ